MPRASLLSYGLALLVGSSLEAQRTDAEITASSAVELRAELAAGRLTALEVTHAFLRRIGALDDTGPELRAVLALNPSAERIARELDEQHKVGRPLGPLHGIPVLIKANIDTADDLATSAGSVALAEHFAERDAPVVAHLRAAGAVLLGKTNLSEWANFRSLSSTSGWSSLGGQTRNPYVLDRNPCGSSSGSAVAVAAQLAPLAVGTETDGSIVCPAAANGVVGVKPTLGSVSQEGIIPIAASQDTTGPLARTVEDAALLLEVLLGRSLAQLATRDTPTLVGLRVGVVRDYHGARQDTAVEASFTRLLESLRSSGAVLVDPVAAALPPAAERAELVVLVTEFKTQLASYLAQVRRGPRTLDELIAFNEAQRTVTMPHFGQDLLLAARGVDGSMDVVYREARTTIEAARMGLAQTFAVQSLDVLVAPANARAWVTDYASGDEVGVSSSNIAAVSGYPSVVVPIELSAELPLGIALIGKPNDEALLLAVAAQIEFARGSFPKPRFLPTVADVPR